MPHLWVYKRRQNTLARHKHGGFNASFPMNGHTILQQMALDEIAREEEAARQAQPPKIEARSNILNFAERRGRVARTSNLRGGKRPGDGPSKHRD